MKFADVRSSNELQRLDNMTGYYIATAMATRRHAHLSQLSQHIKFHFDHRLATGILSAVSH